LRQSETTNPLSVQQPVPATDHESIQGWAAYLHVPIGRDELGAMTQPHGLPKGIGAPATRALVAAGYTSIDHLAGADAAKLPALPGVGPRALRIIAETLAERGAAPMTEQ